VKPLKAKKGRHGMEHAGKGKNKLATEKTVWKEDKTPIGGKGRAIEAEREIQSL